MTNKGVLIVLLVAVLAAASDVEDYVFVEFNPKMYFPYLVKNNTTEPAPIVYLMTNRDVVAQELAANTSMYIPQGVYLAIPRHLFSQRPPAVPRGVKGRVVDVEVEGLGVVRLLLARNSTEVPDAHADYMYLDVEERGGRLYYRGKPLEVRKPKNVRGQGASSSEDSGASGDAAPLYSVEHKTGTAVYSWARYVFNPASPAKIRNIPLTQYTPIRYFNVTGFNGDFVVGHTAWAYLGYGVSDIYLVFYGGSASNLRYYLCPYSTPTERPPHTPTSSPCVGAAVNAPRFGRAYMVKISVALYSNYYLWFYAEIYNPLNLPVNASIAAVYIRPAPWDSSVYSALVANWHSSVGQPGYAFNADYGSSFRVARLLFSIRVPHGAQLPIGIRLRGLTVYTCSSSPTLTVRIYTPADPTAAVVATGQKYVTTTCGTYHFSDISGILPESAVVPILAANTTAIPIILEFDPPLYASYPERVYVSFINLAAYGQRWPEIWRHNAYNWVALDRYYTFVNMQVNVVPRDLLSYSVWPRPYYPYNESSPWKDLRAQAYVSLVTQAGSGLYLPYLPRVAYEYVSMDSATRLKKVCLAVESRSSTKLGAPGSITIFIDRAGSSPILEFFASVASGVLSAISNAATFFQVLYAVFGLSAPAILGPVGYVTWGLGLFIQLVAPSSDKYSCHSTGWLSDGYRAGTGYITSAAWEIGINTSPLTTGGMRVRFSIQIQDEYSYLANPIQPSSGSYDDFFSYAVFDRASYFAGALERYAIGTARYYVKVN